MKCSSNTALNAITDFPVISASISMAAARPPTALNWLSAEI